MRAIAHLVFYIVTIAAWWSLPQIAADASKLRSPIARERTIARGFWITWGLVVTFVFSRAAFGALFGALQSDHWRMIE